MEHNANTMQKKEASDMLLQKTAMEASRQWERVARASAEWIYVERIHQIYKRNCLDKVSRQSHFTYCENYLMRVTRSHFSMWIEFCLISCSLKSTVNMTLLNPPHSFYTELQSLIFGGLLFRFEFICMSDAQCHPMLVHLCACVTFRMLWI